MNKTTLVLVLGSALATVGFMFLLNVWRLETSNGEVSLEPFITRETNTRNNSVLNTVKNEDRKNSEEDDKGTLYHNNDYGFSLVIPDELEVAGKTKYGNSLALTRAVSPQQGDIAILIGLPGDVYHHLTAHSLADYEENYQGAYFYIEIFENQELDIHGYPVLKQRYAAYKRGTEDPFSELGSTESSIRYVFWDRDKAFITLEGALEDDSIIVSSFRFRQ